MISALTGIQIGPRQLELPPNMPVSDSAGRYDDAVFLVADVEHVGMLGVVARERPDAVGAEELVLVEHLRQHAAELRLVQDCGEPAARLTGLGRVVDERGQLRARLEEPPEAFARPPGTSS